VFEEKVSGKLAADDRPALLAALSHIRDSDLLTVQEVQSTVLAATSRG
jgi:hypothetical protein